MSTLSPEQLMAIADAVHRDNFALRVRNEKLERENHNMQQAQYDLWELRRESRLDKEEIEYLLRKIKRLKKKRSK